METYGVPVVPVVTSCHLRGRLRVLDGVASRLPSQFECVAQHSGASLHLLDRQTAGRGVLRKAGDGHRQWQQVEEFSIAAFQGFVVVRHRYDARSAVMR